MAKDVIARLKADTTGWDRGLNKAKQSSKGLEGSLNSLKSGLTSSIGAMAKLTTAAGLVSGALKVMKDAFMSSETNIDAWGRTMSGAKEFYKGFVNALNTQDWGSFFSNIDGAIESARELYDMFDHLNSMKVNNAPFIATLQNKLAELRLMKQEGKDVDQLIQSVSGQLAVLQSRTTDEAKEANKKGVVTELIMRGLSKKQANAVADQLLSGGRPGQDVFDEAARNVDILTKRGTTKKTFVTGPGTSTTVSQFDIDKLSSSDRNQYIISKAVKDGETAMSEFIQGYADAVAQEGQIKQQQYKYNKWGGKGSSSSSGSRSGGKEFSSGLSFDSFSALGLGTTTSMNELNKALSNAQRGMNSATDQFTYAKFKDEYERIQKMIEAQPLAIQLGISVETEVALQDQWDELKDKMEKELPSMQLPIEVNTLTKGAKDIESSWSLAAQSIGKVGSALQGVNSPAINLATALAETIATIGLAYAQTLAKDKASKSNIWSFIASAAAASISLAVTTASFKKSMKNYAEGGIIGGNNYSGDIIPMSNVNSGEMIINATDQKKLYNAIHGEALGFGAGGYKAVIRGEDIHIISKNYRRRSGATV